MLVVMATVSFGQCPISYMVILNLEIRTAGIAYLRDNPERFIESNTENSGMVYLNKMSMPGTWGNAIIIQAVADQLQLKLIIGETHERFQAYCVVLPVLSTQQLTNIYLGHIDEYHYVSTLPGSFLSGFSSNEVNSEQTLDTGKINITENTSNRNDETISPNHLTDIQRTIQPASCDQLWYKHSVVPASTLRKNNPDVQTRLLNKVSVNNVEWLCKTCNKHLKNNIKGASLCYYQWDAVSKKAFIF